jgi:hypothetical protein
MKGIKMLISHKNKFIVLNIPKTGCNSRTFTFQKLGVIDVYGDGAIRTSTYLHSTLREIVHYHFQTDVYFSYYKWAMVRNPWRRYISILEYNLGVISDKSHPDHAGMINWWNKCNTNEYNALKNIILYHGKPQIEFLVNDTGDIVVDHIARFENINLEHDMFCKKVNIQPTPTLKHTNKSPNVCKKGYKEFYTQELVDLVADRESEIINITGYQY